MSCFPLQKMSVSVYVTFMRWSATAAYIVSCLFPDVSVHIFVPRLDLETVDFEHLLVKSHRKQPSKDAHSLCPLLQVGYHGYSDVHCTPLHSGMKGNNMELVKPKKSFSEPLHFLLLHWNANQSL